MNPNNTCPRCNGTGWYQNRPGLSVGPCVHCGGIGVVPDEPDPTDPANLDYLRDSFASAVVPIVLARASDWDAEGIRCAAEITYQIADALLIARQRKPE